MKKTFSIIDKSLKKPDSILWILHESTLEYLRSRIEKYKYIATIYEMDKHLLNNKKLCGLVRAAHRVVVPEYNRAWIMGGTAETKIAAIYIAE